MFDLSHQAVQALSILTVMFWYQFIMGITTAYWCRKQNAQLCLYLKWVWWRAAVPRKAEVILWPKKKENPFYHIVQLYKLCNILRECCSGIFLAGGFFITYLKLSVPCSPWSQRFCKRLLHLSSTSLLQQLSAGFLFCASWFAAIFQADRLCACSERFALKYEVAKSVFTELVHEKMVHLTIQNCKQAFAFTTMSFCGFFSYAH